MLRSGSFPKKGNNIVMICFWGLCALNTQQMGRLLKFMDILFPKIRGKKNRFKSESLKLEILRKRTIGGIQPSRVDAS